MKSRSGARCALHLCHSGRDAQPLDSIDFASDVPSSGVLSDALPLYQLNVEMVPTSTFALRSLAEGSFAMGDTTAAVASYEGPLALNPNDAHSSAALTRLRRR